jgi:hypothetical protein
VARAPAALLRVGLPRGPFHAAPRRHRGRQRPSPRRIGHEGLCPCAAPGDRA